MKYYPNTNMYQNPKHLEFYSFWKLDLDHICCCNKPIILLLQRLFLSLKQPSINGISAYIHFNRFSFIGILIENTRINVHSDFHGKKKKKLMKLKNYL